MSEQDNAETYDEAALDETMAASEHCSVMIEEIVAEAEVGEFFNEIILEDWGITPNQARDYINSLDPELAKVCHETQARFMTAVREVTNEVYSDQQPAKAKKAKKAKPKLRI